MLPVSGQHGAIFSMVPLWLGFQWQCKRGITHDERDTMCCHGEPSLNKSKQCNNFQAATSARMQGLEIKSYVMLSKPRKTRCLDSADKTKTRVLQQ